jgi:glycosyltransferase involved in cell wall biosynthesis
MLLERDFPPDLRVENEAMALVEAGHKVFIACFTRSGKTQVFQWKGIKIFKKHISDFIYKSSVGCLKFPFYFNFWRRFIAAICSEEHIDAIHVHDLPLARMGVECKALHGRLFVLDLHENWPAFLEISQHTKGLLGKLLSSRHQWLAYEREMVQSADAVIVVVDEAKNRLVIQSSNPGKIHVVSNYINYSGLTDLQLPEKKTGEFSILYAGGINKHRGLQYIIKAMPLIIQKHPQVKLQIAGNGNYINNLKKLSKKLNTFARTWFYGQVPYHKMLEMIAGADVAVIPHVKSEHTDTTIPHKLFQYMYYEKPVIASDCAPVARIVSENNVGFVYHYNKPDEFADIIDKLIKGEIVIQYKRDQIIRKYNWAFEKSKLLLIYQ